MSVVSFWHFQEGWADDEVESAEILDEKDSPRREKNIEVPFTPRQATPTTDCSDTVTPSSTPSSAAVLRRTSFREGERSQLSKLSARVSQLERTQDEVRQLREEVRQLRATVTELKEQLNSNKGVKDVAMPELPPITFIMQVLH